MKLSLIDLFIEQAKQNPSKIALVYKERSFTYQQLNERSNAVSSKLLESGLRKNSVVGIGLPKGFEQICAILGTLKAGHSYLPLDLKYPKERIEIMLKKSKVQVLLGERDNLFENLDCIPIKEIGDQAEDIANGNESGYVIFTSGSTGTPKGVQMGHAALSNLISWQNKQIVPGKTLQFAPISFDVHFQEIFGTLCSGETLVLASEEERADFGLLLAMLEKHDIENLFLPFVALDQLAKIAKIRKCWPTVLKRVAVAGEQLRINENIREFFVNTKGKLFNHYGPSETHVCLSKELPGNPMHWDALPAIGKPIDNVDVQINNGELLVGGICLANGYINDSKITQEKFVKIKDQVFYKTGDVVEIDDSGDMHFKGRLDDQVKINGHRVELGEIEKVAQKFMPGLELCAGAPELENGHRVLFIYIKGEQKNKEELIKAIRGTLPKHLWPHSIIEVEKFPLGPSGKLDRKTLPIPKLKRGQLDCEYVPPKTDLEKKITNIWKRLLLIDEVGIDDKFFDLGGTSLLAMDLVEELKILYPNISPASIFEATTVRAQSLLNEQDINVEPLKKSIEDKNRDVAIVGMTGRFPGADSVSELWKMLRRKESGLKRFSAQEVHPSISSETLSSDNYVRVEGVIRDRKKFDAAFFGMTPRESELMDPQQRKMLELSWEALETAGIDPKTCSERIGIFAGCGNNTYRANVEKFPEKIKDFGEFNVMLANEKDYIATRPAYKLGLKGPAVSLYTGCSTSLVAVIQAVEAIRNNQCEIAIAGGISIGGQDKLGYVHQEGSIYSKDGGCWPYSENASGTVFTEGAGLVVLTKRSLAKANNQTVYGIIKGVGLNNDGSEKMSFTAPSVRGQCDAIISAIRDSGVDPNRISYVEGHGTATPVGGPIEVEALTKAFNAFGSEAPCYLGSIKSNIGHLTAAAGIASVIKACLSLRHGVVPATLGLSEASKKIGFEKTKFKPCAKEKALDPDSYIGVSSFGVGGTNAHIVLQKGDEPFHKDSVRDELFILSAKNKDSLELMQNTFDQLGDSKRPWRDESYTLTKRTKFSFRSFRTKTSKWSPIHKTMEKELIFMFPGQGSQYVAMGKALYNEFSVFKNAFDMCCSVVSEALGEDFLDIMLEDSAEHAKTMNNTYYTQPAILTIEYSMVKLLESFDVKPDSYIGHSIGEMCACVCSNILSIEDALKIVCKRSQLMSSLEKGGMMTVSCGPVEVEELIDKDLQIAAINGPTSVVVAGEMEKLRVFGNRLDSKQLQHKLLHTSHAFHSKMMNPIIDEFKSYLMNFEFALPKRPFISTVTGDLEDKSFCSPDYWAEHVARTVLFAPSLERILDEDAVYLEIGPRMSLSQLGIGIARDNNKKCSFISISGQNPGVNEFSYFLNCLGRLWQEGFEVNFDPLYKSANVKIVPTVTYQFRPTEFWLEGLNTEQKTIIKDSIERGDYMSANCEFKKLVSSVVEDASGIELGDFDEDTCFFEMGMDSLFLTQVVQKINKRFNTKLGFRQLAEQYNTINNLSSHLESIVNIQEFVTKTSSDVSDPQSPAEKVRPTEEIGIKHAQEYMADGNSSNIIKQQLELMRLQLEVMKNGGMEKPLKKEGFEASISPSTRPKSNLDKQKAFGAMAKINSKSSIDHKNFKPFYEKFAQKYNSKTKSSKAFAQKHRFSHADPRVVTGFKPEAKEIVYPIVAKSSKGQKLYDMDGNEYVDMLCGFGSNFFGNSNDRINAALVDEISSGMEIGPQHPMVGNVSRLISKLTGNDRSAFCNTGSEAVLGAMRVARTVTGRDKIICFSGSYHGIIDEVIIRSSAKGLSLPAAPGIPSSAVENMVVLDYGEDESLKQIEQLCASGDIAAVLVEPVQSRRCDLHPKAFLKKVREITADTETCLIFDEVITGFRIHPGGAQAYFGIKADLCTYGKIVGGGMPIGVLSGRSIFMDALDGGQWKYGDESVPTVGVTYFAGTFVRHPLVLRAANEALKIIKEEGIQGLEQLNQKTQDFVEELNSFLDQCESNLRFINFGSLLKPKWKEGDYQYSDLFFAMLRNEGVHQYDGFPWFINLAHTQAELNFVKEAIKRVVEELQAAELMPGTPVKDEKHKPLETKARLGKDKNGNPAWFIPSPNNNGQYIQVQ